MNTANLNQSDKSIRMAGYGSKESYAAFFKRVNNEKNGMMLGGTNGCFLQFPLPILFNKCGAEHSRKVLGLTDCSEKFIRL
jgi:hypothetical protein